MLTKSKHAYPAIDTSVPIGSVGVTNGGSVLHICSNPFVGNTRGGQNREDRALRDSQYLAYYDD